MNDGSEIRLDEPCILSKTVLIEKIPEGGLSGQISSTNEQNADIATALDLIMLTSLNFTYDLKPLGGNRISLTGRLEAECEQQCVITLDSVACKISETIQLEFWPYEDLEKIEHGAEREASDLDPEGPEPFEDGMINIGQVAYEIFASGLDPYPRKDGISFVWKNGPSEEEEKEKENPFAVLGAIRDKLD